MTRKSLFLFILSVAVMVVSGTAFINKMIHFTMTMSGHEVQGFGAAAVATYLAGMLPIVFVMLWAVCTGRFQDVEAPKFRMLEMQRAIDRGTFPDGGARG